MNIDPVLVFHKQDSSDLHPVGGIVRPSVGCLRYMLTLD